MNLSRTLTQGECNLESIKCPRKSDLTATFTYKTTAGVGIDISTVTQIKFTVKSRLTGLRAFQKTYTDSGGIALSGGGTGGIFVVTITGTNNTLTFADYDYDVELTLGGAVLTLARGVYRMWDIVSDAATS